MKTARGRRITAGLTLADVSRRSGLAIAVISQIERGRVVATSAELERLGLVLGVRLENRTIAAVAE